MKVTPAYTEEQSFTLEAVGLESSIMPQPPKMTGVSLEARIICQFLRHIFKVGAFLCLWPMNIPPLE